jgi:NADPH:quinone reductase-like Zn-dependent oxidoreductase
MRYGDNLVDRVRALTDGRGADVVLDSVGLPTQAASMAMLAPFGELVHFGDAGGPRPRSIPTISTPARSRSARLASTNATIRWPPRTRAAT